MNKNTYNNPTVGIIVPIYNTAKYIERCLKSILSNTYKNIKVFCVDDGSRDESSVIVENISENDNRVVLIRQQNSGVSVARNTGIEAAFEEHCEVIGFVDSDDWIHPQYIETLLSGITEGYDVSACNYERTQTFSERYLSVNNIERIGCNLCSFEKNILLRNYIWGRLYRSSVINKVRFLKNLNFKEDTLFIISIIVMNSDLKVCYIKDKLYFYFDRENSLVHQNNSGKDLLLFSKCCIDLLSDYCTQNKKSFLIKIIFTGIFSARYLSKFDDDFDEINKSSKTILKKTWKIAKKDNIIFDKRFMFRMFSAFPSLYRLFRIITDRTMLDWEKAQKKKNK